MRLLVLVGALLVAALTACGGGDEVRACRAVFADGTKTIDLDRQPECIGVSGEPGHVGASHKWSCTDEGELFVNDYGWGFKGGLWHADSGAAQRIGTPGLRDSKTPFGRAVTACEPIR